jgi:hypothetical protein
VPPVSPTSVALRAATPISPSAPARTATIAPINPPPPTPNLTPAATLTPSPALSFSLRPETNCSNPDAIWENVRDGQTLKSYQILTGTASADKFASYVVEWMRPGNVLYRSTTPVVHGVLFAWNTFTVPNGEYLIALTVILNDGSALAPCVVRVRVAH